jgi:hypothetical protein
VRCRATRPAPPACRPHGFASIGQLDSAAPLGRLLLHGVHLFLELAFCPRLSLQLVQRLAQ